jgi:hypothetical protein
VPEGLAGKVTLVPVFNADPFTVELEKSEIEIK